MNRIKWILCLVALLLLAGCSGKMDITGVWEQEMEISILGTEKPETVSSVVRFAFREDGTGTMEQLIPDGNHPDARTEFSYELKENTLTVNMGNNRISVFEMEFREGILVLQNSRMQYHLTKVK